MNKFWEDVINEILTILYHGIQSDDVDWVHQYEYESENMVSDIKDFHEALKEAGHEVNNETMANFLIYTEYAHINNNIAVTESIVNMNELITIAIRINDELS